MSVIDYSWGRPTSASLKNAGAVGVARYLSWKPNGKIIDTSEYQRLLAAGLGVVLAWEYDAHDWLSGAGTSHANEAIRQAGALGYPAGAGIYGAADFDMVRAQWDSMGKWYAIAFRDAVRAAGYRVGVYGPYDVLSWCKELGYDLYWQAGMSTAWSGGRNATAWPGVNLRQRRKTTIDGVGCDINDNADDYGQRAEETDLKSDERDWLAFCHDVLKAMASGDPKMWTKEQVRAQAQLNAMEPRTADVAAGVKELKTTVQEVKALVQGVLSTGASIDTAAVLTAIAALEQKVDRLVAARTVACDAETDALTA